METHIIKLPQRIVRLRIADLPDLIIAELSSSAYGQNFNDELLLEEWLRPIVAQYEDEWASCISSWVLPTQKFSSGFSADVENRPNLKNILCL